MVTIVKHEHHQVDSQFAYELTREVLEEIYPDMDEDELEDLWQQLEANEADIDQILSDAYDNGVEIEWDRQYDDWWTERKGGYDVSYEYGDDNSWHTPDTPPEPTHKCSKCRWQGQSYESSTLYLREDGTVIPEDSDEDSHSTKDVCPMCDSDIVLTEAGVQKEKEREEMRKRWAEMDTESLDEDDDEEAIPCFSCETAFKESELEYLGGQYICPQCGEGWVMPDNREEESEDGRQRDVGC